MFPKAFPLLSSDLSSTRNMHEDFMDIMHEEIGPLSCGISDEVEGKGIMM